MLSKHKENEAVLTQLKPSVEKFESKVKSAYPEAMEGYEKPKAKPKAKRASGAKPKKKRRKPSTSGNRKPPTKNGKSVMQIAKEIRKDGEAWRDALKRAGKMMSKEAKEKESKAEADFKKLLADYKEKYGKKSLKGTDAKRDSQRVAKKAGKRTSASGKTYYENRPNRTDRKVGQPDYVKGQYLSKGGNVKRKLSDWTNYIPNRDIQSAKVELAGGRSIQLSGDDILDGLYEVKEGYKGVVPMKKMAKGGKLSSKADYIPRYDIKEVTIKMKNGEEKVIPKGRFIDGIYFKKKKR